MQIVLVAPAVSLSMCAAGANREKADSRETMNETVEYVAVC